MRTHVGRNFLIPKPRIDHPRSTEVHHSKSGSSPCLNRIVGGPYSPMSGSASRLHATTLGIRQYSINIHRSLSETTHDTSAFEYDHTICLLDSALGVGNERGGTSASGEKFQNLDDCPSSLAVLSSNRSAAIRFSSAFSSSSWRNRFISEGIRPA